MQWSELINNPYFENLPFKIELNRYGKIEMTPATNKHGRLKLHVGAILERKLKKGEALTDCSIMTAQGVKVADVAWCSKEFIYMHGFETPYPKAPDICVEIVYPSNSHEEMVNKAQLYLQAGAKEAWVVWEDGIVDYYGKTGRLEKSAYDIILQL